jgi:predicted metal-dependent peptidase
MNVKLTPPQKLLKARMQLLMHQPFFGSLALRLKPIEIPSGTMATDGVHLYWCAEFVEKCSLDEVIGVYAHEILHVANLHHLRRAHREPKRFNIAADAAINAILKEAKFALPKGGVDMPQFKDMATEVIYDKLQQEEQNGGGKKPQQGGQSDQSQQGQGDDQGQPEQSPGQSPGQAGKDPSHGSAGSPETGDGWGAVQDAPLTGAERAHHEHEMKIAIRQAHMAQRMKNQGTTPGWMDRLVEDVCEPQVDWKNVLRQFVSQTQKTDRTWARPNRRFIWQGIYLPGILREGTGEFALITDTSGSMGEDELSQAFAEQKYIVEDMFPERAHFISCDAHATEIQSFEQGEPFEPRFTGGGGSDFRPAFELIEEQGIQPACAIVISDMMIIFPKEPPPYPVLCISTTQQKGPAWAETIHIKVG